MNRRPRRWLVGGAGLLIAVAAIAAGVFDFVLPLSRANQSAFALVEHTQEVIAAISRLQTNVEAADTDRRGFLLTGDLRFLGTNDQSEVIWRGFSEVRTLTADNPRQRDKLQSLAGLMSDKLARIARSTELARGGDVSGAIDFIRLGSGKNLTPAIRQTTADMIAEEQRLLQERRDRAQEFERRSVHMLLGLCIVAAAGVLLSGFSIARTVIARANSRRIAMVAAERQRLLDMVNVAAVMLRDLDGIIVFWSEGCRRLYGWTAEQAIGRLSRELLQTVFPASFADAEAALLRNGAWNGDLRQRRRDGAEVIVSASMTLYYDHTDGRGLLVVETMIDLSALRQAEMDLRKSEAQFHALADTAAEGFVIAHTDGRIESVNRAMLGMFGYDRAEDLIGRNLGVLMPAAEATRHDGYIAGHRAGAPPRAIGVAGRELIAVRRDGSEFPIDLSVSSFGTNGSHHLTGIIRDASRRKRAETALRESEERLRLFIDGAPAAIAMFDTAMCYLAVSRRFIIDYQLDNETAATLIGRSHYEVFPEIPQRWRDVHRRILAGETMSSDDEPFPRRDGDVDWVRWEMVPWRHADGTIGGAMWFSEITTDRKQAEAALRESEARLRLVQQVGGIAYSDWRFADPVTLISEEFARLYDLSPGQTHITAEEWAAHLHPEDRDRMLAERESVRHGAGTLAAEFRICRPDGAVRWVTMRVETFRGPDGQPLRRIGAQRDITDIVAAREWLVARQEELEQRVTERTAALAEAEARFRGIFDSQFQHIGLLAPDGTFLEINRTALAACGLTRDDVIGRPAWETGWWPAAERDRVREEIAQAAQGAVIRREVEVNGAGGRSIQIDFSLKPVRDPATDAVTSIIAEGRDLTEKRNLAAQLAQAQKVQALGQLAGGIAHDFNNILQAVSGAAMLIQRQPGDQGRTRRLAGTVIAAANRGTSITQRLLYFARRGELRAETIATGELLDNMREVLAHTLGTTITVCADAPPDVPSLIADQPQLETAIINLGTNARDAMPDGGTLVLAAAAEHVAEGEHHPAGLAPGAYVRLSVADNGTGMDAATLARVSEPFFTTKPHGQGTGLGLAMAKGFAEQSGGGSPALQARGLR